MNLFFLDLDPKKCAEYHCDKHVVKMILEITQMLYTAHYIHCTPELPIDSYKPISNRKHPMNIWISLNENNYSFALRIAKCLSEEYSFRYYNKIHSCDKHLRWLNHNIPDFKNILNYSSNTVFGKVPLFEKITPIPLCMPEDSMDVNSAVQSYRNYYLLHKQRFTKWTKRPIPEWFRYSSIRNYF